MNGYDADIDVFGGHLALLLKNRSIRVLELSTADILAEVLYQREHPKLAGAPLRGVLSADIFCFVTSHGRVGLWNWKTSTLDHVANCYEKTEQQPIAIFDVLENEAKLLISFPTHGILVDLTQLHQITVKHDGRPTQCILPAGHDVLVAASEDESMIRWFSPGLAALGSYPWPRPTCLSYSEDTQEVIAGNRSGFVLYLQFPGATPVREDKISSWPIVAILSPSKRRYVAVDESGRYFELPGGQSSPGSPDPRVSFRTQLKSLSTGNSAEMWSLYESGNTWIFAHLDGQMEESTIVSSMRRIRDASVSQDGRRICIAGDELVLFERRHTNWRELVRRPEQARIIHFVGNNFLAVVLMNRDSYLEIRCIEAELAPVATIFLEHRVLCIGTKGDILAVGLESGHIVSISCRNYTQPMIKHGR